MSIMRWLLAIIARESSEGISPTVSACCALAGGRKAAPTAAAVPNSKLLRFIICVSSLLRFRSLAPPSWRPEDSWRSGRLFSCRPGAPGGEYITGPFIDPIQIFSSMYSMNL
jgi:hypothetical protein